MEKKYKYIGPGITYIDGPNKGQSFKCGKTYTEFPAELVNKMHEENVNQGAGCKAHGAGEEKEAEDETRIDNIEDFKITY